MQFFLPALLLVVALAAVYAGIEPFSKKEFCDEICPQLNVVKKKTVFKALTKIDCKDVPNVPEEACRTVFKEAVKNKTVLAILEKNVGGKIDEWKEECKKLCK
ncbi:hypothetical protein OESDEN_08731 [Oesophagostomum dentatum]|uniref:Saposin B-type domain-containing protein n=1 Tax=Oesophagostomum dentatum TaxID=61180 RepID=A0A0B1T2C6_OESDE|nr:hypothetical protein OESDEN_08731 [Oesophagostomum dentatum]